MIDLWKELPETVKFLYQLGSVIALPVIVWFYNRIIAHTKKASDASNEASMRAADLRSALAISERMTSEKLSSIASVVNKSCKFAEDTHQIVNGAKAILLEEILILKMKIAEITKDPADYKLVDAARERFDAHLNLLMICKKDNCKDRIPIESFSQSTNTSDTANISLPKPE